MEPVTQWISSVEIGTSKLYSDVADYFCEDKQFSEVVRNMAKEEEEHYALILRAIDVIGDKSVGVMIDSKSRIDYERPIREGEAGLKNSTLTKDGFIALMVEIEFSLYNEIFIYVMNLAKEAEGPLSKEFDGINVMLRHHRYELESFLKSRDEYKKYLKIISRIPEPWHKRVLVVDDSEALAEFFKAVLESFADVDTARNGDEGLKKLSEHHYDLVVTDVEMPLVTGVEFFEEALRDDSSFKDRFIFCAGDDMSDNMTYLKANDLNYFVKPVNVGELKSLVEKLL